MGVPWGAPNDLNTFLAMVNNIPSDWTWSAFSLGRDQMPYVAAAVAGGNVRVGLEDNLWLDKGVLARNEQLVERAVGIIERQAARPGSAAVRSKLGPPRAGPHDGAAPPSSRRRHWRQLARAFLLNGWDVTVFDPDPQAHRKISEVLANAHAAAGTLMLPACRRRVALLRQRRGGRHRRALGAGIGVGRLRRAPRAAANQAVATPT
jgi:hypothetical protein